MKDVYFSKLRTTRTIRIPNEIFTLVGLDVGDVVTFKVNPDQSVSFGKADIKLCKNGE